MSTKKTIKIVNHSNLPDEYAMKMVLDVLDNEGISVHTDTAGYQHIIQTHHTKTARVFNYFLTKPEEYT